MTKISRLLIFPFLLFNLTSYTQTTISDCTGAIGLCGDLYTEDQAPLTTGNVFEFTGICNQNVETNSVWYTFTVGTDGILNFTITPENLDDDYDWGIFNVTDGGCAGLADGTSPEVSCNSWGTLTPPNGATGISTASGGAGNGNGPGDLNGPPFNADLQVLTGQSYALVVMNWSNSPDGYTIDFGGSTSTIYDDIPPALAYVQLNCGTDGIIFQFSEPILVDNVEVGDFVITGPQNGIEVIDISPVNNDSIDSQYFITLNTLPTTFGTYTVTITSDNGFVTDACGNNGVEGTTFEIAAPLTFTTSVLSACNGFGGEISVANISGQGPYQYFLNGQQYFSTPFSFLAAGDYTLEITDQSGCPVSQTVNVPDLVIAVTIPSDQQLLSCVNTEIEITGIQILPDIAVTYNWYTFDGQVVSGLNTDTPTIGLPGTYYVDVVSESGCYSSGFITIPGFETISVTVPEVLDSLTCADPALQIPGVEVFPNQAVTYNWTTAEGEISAGASAAVPTVTMPGEYFIEVTSNITGCTAVTSVIVDGPQPVNVIVPFVEDSISCLVIQVQLFGVSVFPAQNVTYQWTSASGGTIVSGADTDSPVFGDVGSYNLLVTNVENGCTASGTTVVFAQSDFGINPNHIRFPNIITSNNDESNEVWRAFYVVDPYLDLGAIIDNFHAEIFNRWGQKIFETDSVNGAWSAKDEDTGSYFYIATFSSTCSNFNLRSAEGSIQVVR
jgi:hypothetical protein